MRKLFLLSLMLFLALVASAQDEVWQNPKVNAINRAPMHSYYFAYESAALAAKDDRSLSENYLSLKGLWRFNWVRDADMKPTNFYKVGYNAKDWGTMPVPGMWELNGYGDPQYVNAGYPWRNQFDHNPPTVPVENNHVGSYLKEINIPADWKGKAVYVHFGSVTSNIKLWVNGKFVGYSEDSKLEAEFELTKYVKPGKNLIAFQVHRWCDGSYLEDQDFWRFAGVARDCYLYARTKTHISDIKTTPDLTDNYTNGALAINVDVKGSATVELRLTDADGTVVSEKTVKGSGLLTANMAIENPAKWTAETPNLYQLTATLKKGSAVLEVIPVKVGFRKVEMKNSQLHVNGKAILIKGVNRHELDPDGGYVISRERMIQDIELMKKFNVNAVRTCHYPDDNMWYDLCDEYGIYMVAEANVESHGMGYGERTLAKNPVYAKAHLERNKRNVLRNFNHPSVIIWSLGNEAGFGPNFEACYTWIKDYDKSRPVQYEQGHGNAYTDIYCPMYLPYNRCEDFSKKEQSKPLIQCEYAHAMGNSMGGFKEYWDMIRKYPLYQGGFIWDYVDQSIRWKGKDGVEIYAYGGDFNPYDAHDNNFLDNGLISPDRKPNPHYYEVGYFYQSVWTTATDIAKGEIEIYNEYFFRDLSAFYLEWELVADGNVVEKGTVWDLNVAPQQKAKLKLGIDNVSDLKAKEVFVNVYYKQKKEEQLVPAGYTLAKDQLTVRAWDEALEIATVEASNIETIWPVIKETDKTYLIVKGENFTLDINRYNGFLSRYVVNGKELLEAGTQLVPNFWRAPTDNDYGAKLQEKYLVWKNPKLELKEFTSELKDGMVVVTAKYAMPDVNGKLELAYTINNVGAIQVTQKLVADTEKKVSELFRFGMKLEMPKAYGYTKYYGRGPGENYSDRKYSEFVGLYSQSVEEQFFPYIRPQENGTKTDVRWWSQVTKGGKGVTFTSDAVFSASALKYTIESLDDGAWKGIKGWRHSPEIAQTESVNVCIDKVQLGLGCRNSWGAVPLKQYRLPYKDYEFNFMITPVCHQIP